MSHISIVLGPWADGSSAGGRQGPAVAMGVAAAGGASYCSCVHRMLAADGSELGCCLVTLAAAVESTWCRRALSLGPNGHSVATWLLLPDTICHHIPARATGVSVAAVASPAATLATWLGTSGLAGADRAASRHCSFGCWFSLPRVPALALLGAETGRRVCDDDVTDEQ